ncbi:hypothetical protein OH460_07600 [Vibrio sp. Makdt]|uniref:hypothetical protein n=1 Tax=Vibrio sp. Makdt TaxID=2998828 RepID=UPI0022CDB9E4|nr:hypothetical protein [Vibrio sp. Makdt]MDA0152162.1 hypothetical protein [Vibrio sp. Makdt]
MIKIALNQYPFEAELLNSSTTSTWLRDQLTALEGMCSDDLRTLCEDSYKLTAAIKDRTGVTREPIKPSLLTEQSEDFEGAYSFLVEDIKRTEKAIGVTGHSVVEKYEFSSIEKLKEEYILMAKRYAQLLVDNGHAEGMQAAMEDFIGYINPMKRPSLD